MPVLAVIVIIATVQISGSGQSDKLTYLKMTLGSITSSRNLVVSLPSRFWYPNPAPFSILPLSLKEPHVEASGLANGICDTRILGPGGGSAKISLLMDLTRQTYHPREILQTR
jgi:hypothetical protein